MQHRSIVLSAIAVSALAASAFAQEPANKPAVGVNRGNPFTFTAPGQTVRILSELVKTSKPTDLLLSVTAESAIITDVTTTGNDSSAAEGAIKVFITIDGQVVTPGPAPSNPNTTQGDTAEIVFANQAYRRDTSLFDDQDATIHTYLRTKHSAGFNWAVLNVGSGVHTIEVFARYDQEPLENFGNANATGVIGNRSLVVQPVKCQVNESVVDGTIPTPIAPITLN